MKTMKIIIDDKETKTFKVKADTWNRSRPDRNKPQIISKKTRWEYLIK